MPELLFLRSRQADWSEIQSFYMWRERLIRESSGFLADDSAELNDQKSYLAFMFNRNKGMGKGTAAV